VALTLSIIALALSAVSAIFAGFSARAAGSSARSDKKSARAAQTAEHISLQPVIVITKEAPVPSSSDRIVFRMLNVEPQDLDEVIIHPPRHNKNSYPISVGRSGNWVNDKASLGPLKQGDEVRFSVRSGGAKELPNFVVKIEFHKGDVKWDVTEQLP
jgi:hypothetical protein